MKLLTILCFMFLPLFSTSQTPELSFINEVNLVRTNPTKYCQYIKEYLSGYVDTSRKKIANEELIPLLLSMSPLKPLLESDTLTKMLDKHKVDSIKNEVHHDLTWLNIKNKQISENIVMSTTNNYRQSVILLLIDSYDSKRGHRLNILNPNVTHTAVKRVSFGNEKKPFTCRIYWIQEFVEF